MAAQLLPNVIQRFFDSNGAPLVGGKLYSYAAGTTTPQATYTDESAVTPNSNPTILDASGGASVWITNAGYKFVLQDANGNVQWTKDNVYNIVPGEVGNNELAGNIPVSKLDLSALTSGNLPAGCIGTINILAKNITTGLLNDGAVTFPKIDPNLDLTEFNKTCEVVFSGSGVLDEGVIQAMPQYPWVTPTLLSNPSTIPSGSSGIPAWTRDGKFLAIPCSSSPYVYVYARNGSKLTVLGGPDAYCVLANVEASWSPDGMYLALAGTSGGLIYRRSGNLLFFVRTTSAIAGSGVAWSPDGQYFATTNNNTLAICSLEKNKLLSTPNGTNACWLCTTSAQSGILAPGMGDIGTSPNRWAIVSVPNASQIIVESLDSGTEPSGSITFSGTLGASVSGSVTISSAEQVAVNYDYYTTTQITSATVSGATFTAPRWSPDGANISVAHNVSPYISTWSFDGSTLSAVTAPTSLPPASCSASAWSPDGSVLAVGTTSSPYILLYQWNGSTFTLLTAPATLPTGSVVGLSWSANGAYLACAMQASPYILIYAWDGTKLTAQTQPVDLPTGNAAGVAWSPSNQFLTVTGTTTPYIFTYQTTGVIPAKSLLWVRQVNNV